jgi:NitT/TauT family transport system permease protein
VIILGLWEYVGRRTNPIFLSYPTAICRVMPEMIRAGLLGAAKQSLTEVAFGFLIAVGVGITVGLLAGRYRLIADFIDLPVTCLYSTPEIALVPMFMLWFGLGLKAKVIIILYSAVFPILVNTRDGVGTTNQDWIDAVRAEGATQIQMLRYVVVPAALPSIMTGLRLGVGRSVVAMIVAELYTAVSGLGGQMTLYANQYRTDKVFVIVIFLSIIGAATTALIKWLERVAVRWQVASQLKF